MLSIKTIIMLVLATVIAVTLVPTVWDAVYTDVLEANTCGVYGNYTCANSTTATLLKLVPFLFVALVVIVGVLLAAGVPVPGT